MNHPGAQPFLLLLMKFSAFGQPLRSQQREESVQTKSIRAAKRSASSAPSRFNFTFQHNLRKPAYAKATAWQATLHL
jgi:hypothetical protein